MSVGHLAGVPAELPFLSVFQQQTTKIVQKQLPLKLLLLPLLLLMMMMRRRWKRRISWKRMTWWYHAIVMIASVATSWRYLAAPWRSEASIIRPIVGHVCTVKQAHQRHTVLSDIVIHCWIIFKLCKDWIVHALHWVEAAHNNVSARLICHRAETDLWSKIFRPPLPGTPPPPKKKNKKIPCFVLAFS